MNNPPAFPRNILDHGHGVISTHESGMTLRDYFAAKAMAAILQTDDDLEWDDDQNSLASAAYGYADAMLRVREKGWEAKE